MENNFIHTGLVHYNFQVSLNGCVLELILSITNSIGVKIYMKNLTDECLPTKLKEEFVKVKNLFLLLKKKDSFEVDFLRGRIVLFSGIKDI